MRASPIEGLQRPQIVEAVAGLDGLDGDGVGFQPGELRLGWHAGLCTGDDRQGEDEPEHRTSGHANLLRGTAPPFRACDIPFALHFQLPTP